MSVIIQLRFPWGRYHATAWGRHVNEGAVDWPPAPWRLLRALYATWRHRVPELPESTVHPLLERLAEVPPDYVVPRHRIAHTRHYLPDGKAAGGAAEGRDLTFDTFAVVERGAALHVRWPVNLSTIQHDALSRIVVNLPYLGRAESVCEARLVPNLPSEGNKVRPAGMDTVDGGPRLSLLGPVAPLDFAALLHRGTPDLRGTRWIDYETVETDSRPARRPVVVRTPRPTAFRWTYTARAQPSVKASVTVGHILRAACQSAFGKHHDGATSPTLSGRATDGPRRSDGHSHAHYLSTSADGRFVDTLVAWAPEGFGRDEVRALGTLTELGRRGHISDFRPGRLGLVALGQVEHVAPELTGPAVEWQTVTPFAPARHLKRHTTWPQHVIDQIRFELAVRAMPEPVSVELVSGRWLDYRRHRPNHQVLGQAHHATGVRITFAEPIAGPISLGALNHFGLGLFAPVTTRKLI